MAAGVRVGRRRPARIRTVNGERSRGRWHQPTVAAAGRPEDSAPVKEADSHSASLLPKIKDVRLAELVHAVRAIASGDTLLSPAITRRLLEEFVRRPPPGERLFHCVARALCLTLVISGVGCTTSGGRGPHRHLH